MIGSGNPILRDRCEEVVAGASNIVGICGAQSIGQRRERIARRELACCFMTLVVAMAVGTGCKKEAKVVVPDVTRQDVTLAKQALEAAPLKVGNISGVSGTPPPGTIVVSTSPGAGQQVAANSVVDLVVLAPVPVPAVAGLSVTDAVSALQQAGLKVAFVSKSSINPFAKPKVEQQTPAANSPVPQNSIVTLVVTTPPDVGGLLGLVSKEPAYQKLKPEYKNILDAFMGNPSTPRSMEDAPAPPGNPNPPAQ